MKDYKSSGVDVEKAEGLVRELKKKFPAIGSYSGVYPLGSTKLAATCDGVGTKIRLAIDYDRHEVVGEDLVAMSINDLFAGGAKPLFFLDYFSCGRLDETVFRRILKGIEDGLEKAGCMLLGGETAEMPDMYKDGEYDLAGFACGTVIRDLDKQEVKKGDVIIGLDSNGIHSNGFSLVRKVLGRGDIEKHIDLIMKPTRIYSEVTRGGEALLKKVKSMAHVTGGGVKRALSRLLPEGLGGRVDRLNEPDIFGIIRSKGVSEQELRSVFNMGCGMMLAAAPDDADDILSVTGGSVVGEVV
ncbi:MAG: phosphoribosylformylglycinamidine cyclo-ligase [Elusimicrobia bacterium]|nr:phosphoribosylformylglycinamidine cyclo-ligase [Elusimicrobiota bacterium]